MESSVHFMLVIWIIMIYHLNLVHFYYLMVKKYQLAQIQVIHKLSLMGTKLKSLKQLP